MYARGLQPFNTAGHVLLFLNLAGRIHSKNMYFIRICMKLTLLHINDEYYNRSTIVYYLTDNSQNLYFVR